MIGELPKNLNINNKKWAIRSDYRVALNIFIAIDDPNLNKVEKTMVMLDCIYENFSDMNPTDYEEAIIQANWFLEGGKNYSDKLSVKKFFDWEQDEQMIFSAVNKVANCELRSKKYIHWWTFLRIFF